MATMKKNVAGVFYISLWNANGTAYQVNPTLAIGDVKVDLDGVSLGNITTLPIVTPAGSNTIKVDYSAAEVNGNDVVFKFVDVAGAEWQAVNMSFQISVENLDGLDAKVVVIGVNVDDIETDTVEIGLAGVGLTNLGGMSATMKIQVNAEALDVLVTDTHAEPTGVPPATASIKDMLNFLKALALNKGTQTSTTKTLRNDTDTVDIGSSTVSDDGTTFTRNKWS